MKSKSHSKVSPDLSDQTPRALVDQLDKQNMRSGILGQNIPRRKQMQALASPAQQRLWFLHQLYPESAMYNVSVALRLTGTLDQVALEKALADVVCRHEILRTRFAMNDEKLMQIIGACDPPSVAFVDLKDRAGKNDGWNLPQILIQHASCLFDLTAGPLLRGLLVRINSSEHVLIMTMHHIVCDGWSVPILLEDVTTLYQAHACGKPSLLPDLPIQYADFAVWQWDLLQGETLRNQIAYWKKQLSGVEPLELTISSRPSSATSEYGTRVEWELAEDTYSKLRKLSLREKSTLFMTLLAAFQILLSRYSGQYDIAVGSPLAERKWAETHDLIGFFVNTIVLRTKIRATATFRALLSQVREAVLDGYECQDVPFEKVVEELQPERHLARPPLFGVMFMMENKRRRDWHLPGLDISQIEVGRTTEKFDMTMAVVEESGKLKGILSYRTDLFAEESMRRMVRHYQALLREISLDTRRQVGELPMLSEEEQHQLLIEWNRTELEYRETECIQDMFEEQVRKTPEVVALVYRDQQFNYAELNRRSNQLARYLRRLGVGPEVRVGVCMERCPEMVVGLLGILKAGGAYVPLDPTYPRARLQFMVRDAALEVLLIHGETATGIEASQARIVNLGHEWPLITEEEEENVEGRALRENLAYVIYTSGSTGEPKGVAIEHRNAIALLNWAGSIFLEDFCAGIMAQSSVCFDLSVFEIFGPLCWGGRVVLVDNALELKEAAKYSTMRLVSVVPSVMAELLRTSELPDSVRTVILAGEPLGQELVEDVYRPGRVERVFDFYGPTEGTTFATCSLRTAGGVATIGHPIGNTRAYVLDNAMQPAPVGVAGCLYVGGKGISRGYLEHPELTAEKFVPNPFTRRRGERLYNTGDLVKWCADGELEYVGRADRQVKLRGIRIELGEVEAALATHEGVSEAAVVLALDILEQKRLVAFVVPKPAIFMNSTQLLGFLEQELPGTMIPSAIALLDRMPLTPNGKIDRKTLELQASHLLKQRIEDRTAPCLPRDNIEVHLAAIWHEVLGGSHVSIHDNFFDVGGHSLKALALADRVRSAFGKKIPLAAIFASPTLEEMATFIRGNIDSLGGGSVVPIQSRGSFPPFFFIHGVTGLVEVWVPLARCLGPEQPVYGLQSRGLEDDGPPQNRIEDMAALYIRDLKQIQAHGPYHLAGFCIGASVAYEMAQQLIRAGETIGLLALLDASLYHTLDFQPISTTICEEELTASEYEILAQQLHEGYKIPEEHLQHTTLEERYEALLLANHHGRRIPADISVRHFRKAIGIWAINIAARKRYHYKPYLGRITVLQRTGVLHDAQTAQWEQLAQGGIDVHYFPSEHDDFLVLPNAQALASTLTKLRDNAKGE